VKDKNLLQQLQKRQGYIHITKQGNKISKHFLFGHLQWYLGLSQNT